MLTWRRCQPYGDIIFFHFFCLQRCSDLVSTAQIRVHWCRQEELHIVAIEGSCYTRSHIPGAEYARPWPGPIAVISCSAYTQSKSASRRLSTRHAMVFPPLGCTTLAFWLSSQGQASDQNRLIRHKLTQELVPGWIFTFCHPYL